MKPEQPTSIVSTLAGICFSILLAAMALYGAVQIIADRRTPFRTLSEVVYTLGQAEFAELHFVVLQGPTGGGGTAPAAEP